MDRTPEQIEKDWARARQLGGYARAADLGPEGCRQAGLKGFERLNADGKERERAGNLARKFWEELKADPVRKQEYLAFRGRVKRLNHQRHAAGLKPVYGERAQALLKRIASLQTNLAKRKAAASAKTQPSPEASEAA
jgi:hypothetical protein